MPDGQTSQFKKFRMPLTVAAGIAVLTALSALLFRFNWAWLGGLFILLAAFVWWLISARQDGVMKTTLIHMSIFILAAAGCTWYLACNVFMPACAADIIFSGIFMLLTDLMLLSLYFLLLSGKAPLWLCHVIRILMAWLLLLPLLGFISFDLRKMLIIANTLEMTVGKFVSDYNISRCLNSFAIKSLIAAAGVFMALMPLPPVKFAPGQTKKYRSIFLLLAGGMVVMSLNGNPVCKLMLFQSPLDKAMETRQNPLIATNDYTVTGKTTPGIYFLIVGESYDYERAENLRKYKTFYDRIHSQDDYVIFTNTYSVPLLPDGGGIVGGSQYAVTNMLHNASEPKDPEYLLDNPHLFDVMEYCKVTTLTLSNFGPNRIYSNVQRHITEKADHLMITDRDSFGGKYRRLGFQIDNEIPGIIQNWYDQGKFNKEKSFMFIQPLGTHFDDMPLPEEYARKYDRWAVPKDSEGRNRGYLYFDVMLENMIRKMQSFPETRAIIFCSDHSWNRGGDDDKIVMFIWLSEELRKAQPDLQKRLQDMANNKFNNVEMYSLILDIMNIQVVKK